MPTGRSMQLTKQVGEYLVAAELCRQGMIATTFTGNVPEYDLVALGPDAKGIPIQVKTIRGGGWQLKATDFLNIEISGGRQRVRSLRKLAHPDMPWVMVKLVSRGHDEFYILEQQELQKTVARKYRAYLKKHGGRRPRSPESTHCAVSPEDLAAVRDNWNVITKRPGRRSR